LLAWLAAGLPSAAHAQTPSAQPLAVVDGPEMTLYRNGRIYTNDASDPWAEAMLVRGEEILAVGRDDEVGALAEKGTRVIDLEKHFVMPGFNDAHVHMGGAGEDWLAVRMFGAASVPELQKRLAAAVAQRKEGEWITGSGWDHTLWTEKRFPNRRQLDDVSPKNPVILTHVSGHVAVANSLALEIAGIGKDTPDPSGGEIERDGQRPADRHVERGRRNGPGREQDSPAGRRTSAATGSSWRSMTRPGTA
jgi:predicted amidohydrolase YtcJ